MSEYYFLLLVLQENVKYAKFLYQGLEFRDELGFIYGDTVATSQHQWSPALDVPFESIGKNVKKPAKNYLQM